MDILPSARKAIVKAAEDVPDIIDTQAELVEYQLPDRQPPIAYIQPPATDGLRCDACPYVVRIVKCMQNHYRQQHGWVNDNKGGRRARKQAPAARTLPWRAGVHCQRLFAGGPASHWFEVQRAAESEEQDGVASSSSNAGAEDNVHAFEHMMRDMGTTIQALAANEKIKEDDQKKEANAWLGRVGWAQHLEGLRPKALFEMGNPPTEDEAVLQQLCDSIERVMEAAKRVCHRRHVGLATMFEINRREAGTRASRPFDARMETDSWTRYKETWTQLIRIIYRAEQIDDEKRPPYVMTEEQGNAWDSWESSAQARRRAAASQARGEAEARQDAMYRQLTPDETSTASDASRAGTPAAAVEDAEFDQQGLAAVMHLLDHDIKDDEYSNAIISAMAVMGIEGEEGGWCGPMNYTPKMSAIIKVARMMAVYSAHQARKEDIRRVIAADQRRASSGRDGGRDGAVALTEQEAKQRVAGVFPRVRKIVRRFMTRIGEESDQYPVPMEWILEHDGGGDRRLAGRDAAFPGDESGHGAVFHGMVDEARAMLEELTLADEGEIGQLPVIPWDSIEDDNSEQRDGYWFLADERNEWARGGEGYVMHRVVEQEQHRRAWITAKSGSRTPLREPAVRRYQRCVERFREVMWCLMHMTSGQPARASELLEIRFRNTRNGGARNIFISHGQVGFVTAYHKNSGRQTRRRSSTGFCRARWGSCWCGICGWCCRFGRGCRASSRARGVPARFYGLRRCWRAIKGRTRGTTARATERTTGARASRGGRRYRARHRCRRIGKTGSASANGRRTGYGGRCRGTASGTWEAGYRSRDGGTWRSRSRGDFQAPARRARRATRTRTGSTTTRWICKPDKDRTWRA